MKYVPKDHIIATTNCGMAPMRREIAEAKLQALGAGAKLARSEAGVILAVSDEAQARHASDGKTGLLSRSDAARADSQPSAHAQSTVA